MMKKLIALLLLIGLVIGGTYLYGMFEKSPEPQEVTKEMIDEEISIAYELIHNENFENDKAIIVDEENNLAQKRITERLEELTRGYWAKAKKQILGGVAEYIEASPEATEILGIKYHSIPTDISTLQAYIEREYPTSRITEEQIKSSCNKNNISKAKCTLGIAILIKESALDTAYVKKTNGAIVSDVETGKSYNNPAGLKCSKELARLGKNCSYPDDKGFYLVQFNSMGSFLDYFYGYLMTVSYASCENARCMHPYYNTSQSWVDDVSLYQEEINRIFNN